MAKQKKHWSFFRAGGVDQVVLATGDDIGALAELDQKLWVAIACPTKGTEIEEKTLDFVDTDHDGRIRPPEILEAIEWSKKVFSSLDVLLEKGDSLAFGAFNGATPEGKAALVSAKRILAESGKKEAKEITLDDVNGMVTVMAATRFNGDGIIPAGSAGDDVVEKAIEDIVGASGSVVDRSGKPGVDKKIVDGFFEQAAALVAWDGGRSEAGVEALGEATGEATSALVDVEAKIDDYFARCRLAAFDSRGAAALNPQESELATIAAKSLVATDEGVAKLPLARIEGGKALPLEAGVNPAWAPKIARFAKLVVTPLLGAKSSLTEADWSTLVSKLAAHRGWLGKRPAGDAGKLSIDRLKELVAPEIKTEIDSLIAQDAALEADYAQIVAVEKAIRYRREFARLLRNFVTFADFYGGVGASFQAGTLFLDARGCELTVYVNDPAKHAALAGLSGAYLAYCDITRPGGSKKQIVAAFTAGDTDALMVGRNGVFYDRKGVDWDATITSIIENPISIRQAFWSPYKRLVRTIEEMVAKRAAEKEKASQARIDAQAAATANADSTAPAPAPAAPVPEKKMDVGTVAAIGVAVAGVATFVTAILGSFLGLGRWMPIGVLAILLLISGPSMLIAWLKLRKRNLGPILDANAWAVNSRAKVNVPFGRRLTRLATLPEGSTRKLDDPYAEKQTPWKLYFFLLVLVTLGVVWVLGKADPYLPESVKSSNVLHGGSAPVPAPSTSASASAK